MRNSLTILFTFCSMILCLVYLSIGRALTPLEALSRAFGQIGKHGFTEHLPEAGPEDLRRVYRGFNEMVQRLASAEAENSSLQEQLATVQEEERAEIARDLHDEIGPFLFLADVDATTVQHLLADDPRSDVRERVARIREAVVHMQKHVRDMLGRMRAGSATELGLSVAVENLVDFWRSRRPETTCEVAVSSESFGRTVDGTIFRVVQEGLSNAMKHGNPSRVRIEVVESGREIRIYVEDDGAGFDPNAGSGGFGIKGMRERLAQIGGSLEISARTSSQGVRLMATVPSTGRAERESEKPSVREMISV